MSAEQWDAHQGGAESWKIQNRKKIYENKKTDAGERSAHVSRRQAEWAGFFLSILSVGARNSCNSGEGVIIIIYKP